MHYAKLQPMDTHLKRPVSPQDNDTTFFKMAVENSDLGVWIHDILSDTLTWSDRLYEVLGVPKDTPPQLDVLQSLIHPEDKDWVQNEIGQCLANKTRYSVEYRTVRPDNGQIVWLRSTGEALFDAHGQSFVMFGSAFDITHLKNAEFKATAADLAKSEFLANMSHEIRTPMNGIMGIAQVLEYTDLTAHQMKLLSTINRSGDSLIKIIDDILLFSQAEFGELRLSPAPFNLVDCIQDILTLLDSAKSKSPNFELLMRYQPDLPRHYIGDAGRLRQVIINLLGNALKFTEDGYVLLDVSGSVENNIAKLNFTFEDTGIGIPKDKSDVIFDKFSQVDNSRKRKYGGTGLGLAIVKQLMGLMNAAMNFESELGVGSKFSFELSLPVAQAEAQKEPRARILSSKPNILVIDDNEISQRILREQLAHWEMNCICGSSAMQGLKILQTAHKKQVDINLVLLDFEMPNHNGEDFLKALRKHKRFDHIDVIVMSSKDSLGLKDRVKDLGAADYITKPPQASLLSSAIDKCLRERVRANDIRQNNSPRSTPRDLRIASR